MFISYFFQVVEYLQLFYPICNKNVYDTIFVLWIDFSDPVHRKYGDAFRESRSFQFRSTESYFQRYDVFPRHVEMRFTMKNPQWSDPEVF